MNLKNQESVTVMSPNVSLEPGQGRLATPDKGGGAAAWLGRQPPEPAAPAGRRGSLRDTGGQAGTA